MKECKTCGDIKPLSEFGTRKAGKYIRTACKPCYCDHLRSWRNSKKITIDGVIRSGVWLRQKYGIYIEDYKRMYENQAGLCAICDLSTPGRLLVVDHNHHTQEVRALLCQPCNKAIGFARENPETLREMARYVEYYNER